MRRGLSRTELKKNGYDDQRVISREGMPRSRPRMEPKTVSGVLCITHAWYITYHRSLGRKHLVLILDRIFIGFLVDRNESLRRQRWSI